MQRPWGYLLISAILLLLSACGGGTTGTGDVPTNIQGTIKSSSGAPLGGFTVTVNNNSDRAVTDSTGYFELSTTVPSGQELMLKINGNSLSSGVDIGDSPQNSSIISVELSVDVSNGLVTVQSIQISNLDMAVAQEPSQESSIDDPEDSDSTSDDSATHDSNIDIVDGTLNLADGTAAAGFEISVVETGESDTTSLNGKFKILTTINSRSILLKITFGAGSSLIQISGIPRNEAVHITINLTVTGTSNLIPEDPASEPIRSPGFDVIASSVRIRPV